MYSNENNRILKNQEDQTIKKEKSKEYKPISLNLKKIDKKRQNVSKLNSKIIFGDNLYNSYQQIFNELNNLLKNEDIRNVLGIINRLKGACAIAIMDLTIMDKEDLNKKRNQNINWIIGAYEKAYRIFLNRYDLYDATINKMNERQLKELNKIIKDFNIDFRKESYSTKKMIKYSNKLIKEYMITKGRNYQSKIDSYSEKEVSDILADKMCRMSLSEIEFTYKSIKRELQKESDKYFDYSSFQNNFIVAVFKILKERKQIKRNVTLTLQLKSIICQEILLDRLVIKEIENKKIK